MKDLDIVALQRAEISSGTNHIYIKQKKIGIPLGKHETK